MVFFKKKNQLFKIYQTVVFTQSLGLTLTPGLRDGESERERERDEVQG